MMCFVHCTDDVFEPTNPCKGLFSCLCVEVWVQVFKLRWTIQLFALWTGMVWVVEHIDDFFNFNPQCVKWLCEW